MGKDGFKRSENGCRMNWTIGKWSDAKTYAKFYLPDKKESRSCIGLWQAMKSGSIFRILNARNLGLIPPNHQHLSQESNRFGRKTMLCVWWDQEVVYYELLKPGETVNAHCYHQQLIKLHRAMREKRPHYRKKHDKVIFLHDNAPSNTSTMVQNYLETLNWEMLLHPAYSPDLKPSDYHLFSSMGHALVERGTSILTKTSENGLMSGWPRKMRHFFGVVYTNWKMGKMYS